MVFSFSFLSSTASLSKPEISCQLKLSSNIAGTTLNVLHNLHQVGSLNRPCHFLLWEFMLLLSGLRESFIPADCSLLMVEFQLINFTSGGLFVSVLMLLQGQVITSVCKCVWMEMEVNVFFII